MKRHFTYLSVAIGTLVVGIGLHSLIRLLEPVKNIPQAQQTTRLVAANIPPPPSPKTYLPRCSPIRSIDFKNFTYPASPIFGDARNTFTLRNGELPRTVAEIGLSGGSATYGDVTGDGQEEAIISFSEDTGGGSAIVYAAYVYTIDHQRPRFLWGFEAGDRADGGLKGVYAENGDLVVELEGKDKVLGRNLYGGDETSHGACCAIFFTRTRYHWNGRRFDQDGKSEVLPFTGRQ